MKRAAAAAETAQCHRKRQVRRRRRQHPQRTVRQLAVQRRKLLRPLRREALLPKVRRLKNAPRAARSGTRKRTASQSLLLRQKNNRTQDLKQSGPGAIRGRFRFYAINSAICTAFSAAPLSS